MQFKEQEKYDLPLKWLDLMAGCGIRSLRWAIEAACTQSKSGKALKPLQLLVNDADTRRAEIIKRNLSQLVNEGICFQVTNKNAKDLLCKAYLAKRFFDLVDLDCFGCPNSLLQSVIQVMEPEGILILSSTDGRSPTGHDRQSAIRNFAASSRAHPSNWEIALRLHLGVIAKQSWLLGRGVVPISCFSDGRTFRLVIRFKSRLTHDEESQLGFLARCNTCGAQSSQTLLKLKEWQECSCGKGFGTWAINGPLWLGPIQSSESLKEMETLIRHLNLPITNSTKKLVGRLKEDNGLPVFSWSTAELAKRLSLPGPPPNALLIKELQAEGYVALRNGVMPGQIRTDASIGELLHICEAKFSSGL